MKYQNKAKELKSTFRALPSAVNTLAVEADKEIVGLKEILLDCHNSASSLNDWQLVFRINNAIE